MALSDFISRRKNISSDTHRNRSARLIPTVGINVNSTDMHCHQRSSIVPTGSAAVEHRKIPRVGADSSSMKMKDTKQEAPKSKAAIALAPRDNEPTYKEQRRRSGRTYRPTPRFQPDTTSSRKASRRRSTEGAEQASVFKRPKHQHSVFTDCPQVMTLKEVAVHDAAEQEQIVFGLRGKTITAGDGPFKIQFTQEGIVPCNASTSDRSGCQLYRGKRHRLPTERICLGELEFGNGPTDKDSQPGKGHKTNVELSPLSTSKQLFDPTPLLQSPPASASDDPWYMANLSRADICDPLLFFDESINSGMHGIETSTEFSGSNGVVSIIPVEEDEPLAKNDTSTNDTQDYSRKCKTGDVSRAKVSTFQATPQLVLGSFHDEVPQMRGDEMMMSPFSISSTKGKIGLISPEFEIPMGDEISSIGIPINVPLGKDSCGSSAEDYSRGIESGVYSTPSLGSLAEFAERNQVRPVTSSPSSAPAARMHLFEPQLNQPPSKLPRDTSSERVEISLSDKDQIHNTNCHNGGHRNSTPPLIPSSVSKSESCANFDTSDIATVRTLLQEREGRSESGWGRNSPFAPFFSDLDFLAHAPYCSWSGAATEMTGFLPHCSIDLQRSMSPWYLPLPGSTSLNNAGRNAMQPTLPVGGFLAAGSSRGHLDNHSALLKTFSAQNKK